MFLAVKATIIHPATEKHFLKYSTQNCVIVDETPDLYENIVLPHVTSEQFDLNVCCQFFHYLVSISAVLVGL